MTAVAYDGLAARVGFACTLPNYPLGTCAPIGNWEWQRMSWYCAADAATGEVDVTVFIGGIGGAGVAELSRGISMLGFSSSSMNCTGAFSGDGFPIFYSC